jgi:hypothetical protein
MPGQSPDILLVGVASERLWKQASETGVTNPSKERVFARVEAGRNLSLERRAIWESE